MSIKLLYLYCVCHTKNETHSRDTAVLIATPTPAMPLLQTTIVVYDKIGYHGGNNPSSNFSRYPLLLPLVPPIVKAGCYIQYLHICQQCGFRYQNDSSSINTRFKTIWYGQANRERIARVDILLMT